MSPNNPERVLITVDIQANNARLVELTKQLNENKAAQQALLKANKEGRISSDELAAGQVRLRQEAANLTQEQRVLTKANADQKKSTDAAKGSINQLRAELSRTTAAYNALSEEERDNTEAGQALQAQTKALSDRLKELEGSVGDNRREVGNYRGALRDAIKESGFFGGITQKVTEAQEKFSAAQNIAKAAIGGNVTALGFLRLALIATGLGALVVVLGSVVAFLTKSQDGIDLMGRKLAGLKAVVSLVTGAAAEFGAALFKAAENPKQAFTDLVDFIGNNLLNRFKAIGVIVRALADRDFKQLQNGLVQLTVGITDASGKLERFGAAALSAAAAGEKLEAESQRILRAERALNVERAQSRARIEELKKLSEDTTKSVAARIVAAKEAGRIETSLLAEQLKLQDDKIKNELAGQKLRKVVTNEDLDALAELRRERADTAQESLGLQTELQNSLNALRKEAEAEAEAARQYAQREQQVDLLETLKVNQVKAESNQKTLDEQRAAEDAAYQVALTMLERNLDERRVTLETAYAEGILSKEQYEAGLTVLEEGGYGARLVLAKQFNQDVNEADKARTRFHNEQLLKQTEAQRKTYNEQLQAAQAFGSEVGVLFSETLLETGRSLQDFAANVLIIILDSLQKAAQAAAAEAVIKNAPKGFAGIIEAGLAAAAISVAFETAKGLITAKQAKPFARGGVLDGPSHAQGGIPFTVGGQAGFEAEGGEAIINKNSTAMFRPVLSWLNQLGGGQAFARGGVTPIQARAQFADGGLIARSIGGGQVIDYNALAAALSKQPIYAIPSEFAAAEARRMRPRNLSSLGA